MVEERREGRASVTRPRKPATPMVEERREERASVMRPGELGHPGQPASVQSQPRLASSRDAARSSRLLDDRRPPRWSRSDARNERASRDHPSRRLRWSRSDARNERASRDPASWDTQANQRRSSPSPHSPHLATPLVPRGSSNDRRPPRWSRSDARNERASRDHPSRSRNPTRSVQSQTHSPHLATPFVPRGSSMTPGVRSPWRAPEDPRARLRLEVGGLGRHHASGVGERGQR
jgi:hypothetical protein